MSSAKILGAAAAVAILAVPVLAFGQAQTPTSASPADTNPPMSASTPSAPSAGMNTSGVAVSATQLPPSQAQALAQGDNTMVTNGPVPDTAANRAKYGGPMSHAGKKTAPAGN